MLILGILFGLWSIYSFISFGIHFLFRFAFLAFQIYGIDAASGAAVSVLNISPGDHVLDLCAAPGNQSFLPVIMYNQLVQHIRSYTPLV